MRPPQSGNDHASGMHTNINTKASDLGETLNATMKCHHQRYARRHRSQEAMDQEAQHVYLRNACGQRNVGVQHGQHARKEGDDTSIFGEGLVTPSKSLRGMRRYLP